MSVFRFRRRRKPPSCALSIDARRFWPAAGRRGNGPIRNAPRQLDPPHRGIGNSPLPRRCDGSALMDRLTKAGMLPCCEFDGSVKDLGLQRTLVWDLLVQHDVDLIQSDIDAVWLRDPIPEYFSAPISTS